MRPWYRLRDVVRATNVDERTLRYLAEAGRVDVHGYPDEPGTHRMWTPDALAQLEHLGVTVHWHMLDGDEPSAVSAVSAVSARSDATAPTEENES